MPESLWLLVAGLLMFLYGSCAGYRYCRQLSVRGPLLLRHQRNEVAWCQLVADRLTASGEQVLPEYCLPDRSRVDLLFADFACEADWAPKWTEAVGQALFYAAMTERKPAILLLLDGGTDDAVYLGRLARVVAYTSPSITVWTLDTVQGVLQRGTAPPFRVI